MNNSTIPANASYFEKQHGYVLDLKEKIDFLIDEHRGRKLKVVSRSEFDVSLKIDQATRTRWMKHSRIPKIAIHAPIIAHIFDIDEMSFREDSFSTFKSKCQMKLFNWGRVLAFATPDLKAVQPVRFAVRQSDLKRELCDELTVITPLQPFTVKLPSNPDQIDTARWANWHVLLFSGDRDGYMNWVPRHNTTQEFGGKDRFPRDSRSLTIPRAGRDPRVAGRTASGEHDVVMIVSRDRIPLELELQFQKKLYNAQLQPFLDKLAIWLFPRLEEQAAAVVRALYFVGNSSLVSTPAA